MTDLDLPYFDRIIAKIEQDPDSEIARAFHHVHWGCYDDPDCPDDSLAAYLVAADELTRRIADAGRVRDGIRILDVGCGFGATTDALNRRLHGCEIVGLNIDTRQLALARSRVQATNGNTVSFVAADACKLPFVTSTFDVVLAVECIFHFPSRRAFFGESSRLLRADGTLALSDFTFDERKAAGLVAWSRDAETPTYFYGGSNHRSLTVRAYERLARAARFGPLANDDITAATLPTYAALRRIYREEGWDDAIADTDTLEELSRRGFLAYRVLAFSRRNGHAPPAA